MIRPLLPFLSLIVFAACSDPDPSPDLHALQKSREALQIENGQLKEQAAADAWRIRQLEEDLRIKTKDWSERSTKILEESRKRQELVEELTSRKHQLEAELAGLQKTKKNEARTEAVGGQLPLLKTRSGQTYKNVTIRSVVPDGLHIVHQSGATKVLFVQLDSSWGDRFGYNAKEAEAYARAQSQNKSAAQKAQWEALQARQEEDEAALAAVKRSGKIEDPLNKELDRLRSALLSELQDVATSVKGNLGISRSEPENSACFNNNLITLRLSKARDLRAQINDLKAKLGSY